MESNAGSEMEDVRAVANRDHQAATGVELSFKQGPGQIRSEISVLHSHWSRSNETRLLLVDSFESSVACASNLMP